MSCVSQVLTHRDILQCRTSLVANGARAVIGERCEGTSQKGGKHAYKGSRSLREVGSQRGSPASRRLSAERPRHYGCDVLRYCGFELGKCDSRAVLGRRASAATGAIVEASAAMI